MGKSRTYKVYFQFFKLIRSVDIIALSYEDAIKEFLKKYGLKRENIIKVVDYKDIINEYFATQNPDISPGSDSSEFLKFLGNKKPLPK